MKEKTKLLWIDRDPDLYSRNYIGMFDLTKGILMIEIILSHCVNNYFNLLMYNGGDSLVLKLLLSPLSLLRYGAVPMLFMICGYGIRRQPVKQNIKNNLKLFSVPYFCVIVSVTICVVFKWWFAGGSLGKRLLDQVACFFFGFHPGVHLLPGNLGQTGPVWFFFTYIFAGIYLNWILQEQQEWVRIVYLAAGTGFGLALTGVALPFCLQQILICSGFMYTGMYLKKGKIPQQKLRVLPMLLVYWLCSLLTEAGGVAEIGNNIYAFSGLDLLAAYLAGVVLLCLHQRLNVLQGALADGLRWVGRHMMWFCCVHTVSYLAAPWTKLAAYFPNCPAVGLILEIVISFVYGFTVCILLEAGMKKYRALRRKKRRES